MPNMDLDNIATGTGIVFIGIIISKILSYLYRLVIARIGANEYGLFSLGLGVTGIISSIALFGLHRGVLRYVSYYRGKEDFSKIKGVISSALKISFIASFVLGLALFLLSDFISVKYFHNMNLNSIIS